MALISYKPTSPGRRGTILVDKSHLHKGAPEKSLLKPLKSSGGRNNDGKMTVRSRGGGARRKYRMVDFKRNKFDVPATVERLEYDPNRTAFIALIKYSDGELSYIIAPAKLNVGDTVVTSKTADILPGNVLPLKNIPVGTVVHNVEMKQGKGGQMARSAGTSVQLVGRDGVYAQLRLGSGELRLVHEDCLATIGVVSNSDHQNQNFGKAGRTRHKGRRSHTRGAAMNPVDHPHGGGEGKTSGGRHPVSAQGLSAKGKKTRNPRKPSGKMILRSRHRAKKRK